MDIVGYMSALQTVEFIVQNEGLVLLLSVAEYTGPRSSGAVLGGVETPAVQLTIIQELKKQLQGVKRENESLARRLEEKKITRK